MNLPVLVPRSAFLSVMAATCLLLAGCASSGGSPPHTPTAHTPTAHTPTAHTPTADTPVAASPTVVTSTPAPTTTSKHTSKKPKAAVPSSKRTTSPPAAKSAELAQVVPMPTGTSTPGNVARSGPGCVPATLRIGAVGIDESVRALGLNSQGQIYPPPHTTMWYTGSSRPGQDGISVIAGHVMYDGPDNFYNLVNVHVGGSVEVQCRSGKRVSLKVERTASMRKTKLQTDQTVWGSSATPVVVLITCDPNSRVVAGHHLNNFVVWTRPA